MSRLLSRDRFLSRVLILVWVTCASSQRLEGQPPVTEKPVPPNSTTKSEAVPWTGDIIYLKDEFGKPVPVPLNASLKKYLESLERPASAEPEAAPEFSLESLSMQGAVGEDSVELETRIQIKIPTDKRGVVVPLQFKEGILKDVAHKGPGESIFAGYQPRSGYRWWIKGAGTHEMALKFNVPVIKQLQAHRLQITLPRTGISSLKLRVPVTDATFKVQEKTAFEVSASGTSSVIDLIGLGENFDLSWEAAVDRAQTTPVLRARSELSAELQAETVLLKARQQISAVQGQFREIEVRVPTGYQQESLVVEGSLLESVTEIAGRPGWKRILLTSMTSGSVDLIWVFSKDIPAQDAVIRVEGFELGGAVRQQSGTIELTRMPGYLLTERSSRAVFRRDVPPPSELKAPSRTYDFYRQPFELDLELKKIPLSIEADASLVLTVHPDRIQMDAELDLVRYRGLVEILELNWPQRLEEGWRISPNIQSEEIDSFSVDTRDESVVRLHFSEPLDRDRFRIKLTAERPFQAGGGAAQLSLPRLLSALPREGISVLVQGRENLDIQLSPLTEAVPTSLPASHKFPEFYVPVEAYRFPSEKELRLELSATPQEGTVEVETRLDLDRPSATGMLTVVQEFDYRIRYERLKSLRFRVPAQVVELKVFDEQGRGLVLEEGNVALDGSRQARVLLSQPRLGRLTLRLEYALNGATELTEIPFVTPGEATVLSLEATLSRELYEKSRPAGRDWKPLGRTRTFTRQTSSQPLERLSLPLAERDPGREVPIPLRISKCLLLSNSDVRGNIHTRGYFSILGLPEELTIRIPPGYEVNGISLNGTDLPRSDWELRDDRLSLATLRPAGSATAPSVLMVDLTSAQQQKLNWVDPLICQAPRVVGSQGHAQTRWLVEVPYRQHLFLPPTEAGSLNRWDRTGLFWERFPRWSPEELSDWIEVERTEFDDLLSGGGNLYLFHDSGDVGNLKLWTMNRSLVILTGAGVTLVLGFFLLKFPATRNILTLLLLALVLSVCGIFYPAAIALLLQPAALGFCLALAAAAFDRFLRSPNQGTHLTVPKSSIHQERGSSQRSMVSLGMEINPEAQTEMRPREQQPSEKLSSFANGSD